jgi:ankyrin repeat protein
MVRAAWMCITAVAAAGMAGDEEIIALVLPRAAELDIFTAAILADAERVEQWLERDSDLAAAKDVNEMTVLHYAALSGLKGEQHALNQRRIVELLLAHGANPDACEDIGPYKGTPVLHFAAWGNITVAGALLENGANPNLGFGNALWREPGEMAKLFLSHGADPNGREPSGQPLLNSRIHWNLPSVVLWLLENGADPNLTDSGGNTALHEAAKKGINPKVVQALLDSGANLQAKNAAGQTALDVAQEHGKTKVIDLLAAQSY